jgi:crooked neck
LLEKSQNSVKVWISYGTWLFGLGKKHHREQARQVYRDGYDSLKAQGLGEERVMLLEQWLQIDSKNKKEI